MRIAVMIIALCLTAIVGLQSCTVMVGGGLTHDQGLSGGGAAGLLVAFLFVLGAAFALGLPKVSQVIFAIATGVGFLAGAQSGYHDMTVWGVVSLVLAFMSYFGARELKKKRREISPQPQQEVAQ
jgi:membrane protein implicated in regulation of membrane protease activity